MWTPEQQTQCVLIRCSTSACRCQLSTRRYAELGVGEEQQVVNGAVIYQHGVSSALGGRELGVGEERDAASTERHGDSSSFQLEGARSHRTRSSNGFVTTGGAFLCL
jgi:hypothetical protein